MANIKETLGTIRKKHKGLLGLMLALVVISIVLLVFSCLALNFGKPMVNIGYGDVGGYRAGSWVNLLAFPILAITWGVLHNFIALRLYQKRGPMWAVVLVVLTILLVLSAFVVLGRLTGEG